MGGDLIKMRGGSVTVDLDAIYRKFLSELSPEMRAMIEESKKGEPSTAPPEVIAKLDAAPTKERPPMPSRALPSSAPPRAPPSNAPPRRVPPSNAPPRRVPPSGEPPVSGTIITETNITNEQTPEQR